MPKVPDYREIETCISLANIKDQIAALMYASGLVYDNEDIISLTFIGDTDINYQETVPVRIKLKKNQPVEVIEHI